MMVRNLSSGLGPDVTPLATFHDTPVCEDGEQTGAHKVILNFRFFLMLGELLKGGGGGTATGLGPSVKHPELPPSVSWVLV